MILSPDLEQERRSKDAARKQAKESLARDGITVPDKIMEYITSTLGREAVNVTRIEEMARAILYPTPDPDAATKYSLDYGYMGNGLTVWNRLEEEHGDYKTVAHIDSNRSVKFYDATMPESVRLKIVHVAATSKAIISTSQNAPVFSVPPMTWTQAKEMPEAAAAEQTKQAEASVPEVSGGYTTPQGNSYHVGDAYDSYDEQGKVETRFHLTDIDEDYIYYTFPDLPEQEPVKMFRDRFEDYLDRGKTGGFLRAVEERISENVQQPKQMDTSDMRFEYKGYHFEPVGVIDHDRDLVSLTADLVSDPNLGLSNYGDDDAYSHEGFYKAANNENADVFRCLENGKYYLPSNNELFEYIGKFDPLQRIIEQSSDKQADASTLSESASPEKKRPGNSRVERNYRAFACQFPEIISGEYRYLELRSSEDSGFMPLIIQRIGENEISVSHTYEQNGDLMRDPEMTFRIDKDKGALEPLTFQQDGSIAIYQEVYPEPGKWIPRLRNDLNVFTEQWLKNIEDQGRVKYHAIVASILFTSCRYNHSIFRT